MVSFVGENGSKFADTVYFTPVEQVGTRGWIYTNIFVHLKNLQTCLKYQYHLKSFIWPDLTSTSFLPAVIVNIPRKKRSDVSFET